MTTGKLRIAFVHPDLGIGGAERLIVDAALGLQKRGHSVDIYTSHHDPGHCFDETRDGTLRVHAPPPPFPRHIKGKLHILLANARQLHLITHLLSPRSPKYDVYFVDQLSTCVPLLRNIGHTRVVFYCHFPDKLLADGAYVEGVTGTSRVSLLKRLYRLPMDWLEEATTRDSDVILANSRFTSRVFKTHFSSIRGTPRVVYPGINIDAYKVTYDPKSNDADVKQIISDQPTLISLNRFEKKKNVSLAIESFALLRKNLTGDTSVKNLRLVLAGGYDPRLEDNMMTLTSLVDLVKRLSLTYAMCTPSSSKVALPPYNLSTTSTPDVVFLLNFATPQRSALLSSPNTLALLYTPANEHFGIVPIEAMVSGLPVLAANSGGPTESVVDPDFPTAEPGAARTGWLRKPEPESWAKALAEIVAMPDADRRALGERAKRRAEELFGMDAMARQMEEALVAAVAMGPVSGSSWAFTAAALVALLSCLFLLLGSQFVGGSR